MMVYGILPQESGQAMQKGCEAVNAVNGRYGLNGERAILKALHFTDPNTTASWYAEQAAARGIDYDVFAVSAYPFWHGSPDDLAVTLKNIAKTYNKKVMVAETAYPHTFDNADSTGNNVRSKSDMSYSGYEVSVGGQKKAVYDVFLAVAAVNTQAGTRGYGLGGFLLGACVAGCRHGEQWIIWHGFCFFRIRKL